MVEDFLLLRNFTYLRLDGRTKADARCGFALSACAACQQCTWASAAAQWLGPMSNVWLPICVIIKMFGSWNVEYLMLWLLRAHVLEGAANCTCPNV